jgi:hypothetical protein
MLNLSRTLLLLGVIFLLASGLLYIAARFNIPFGRLPGDIHIQGENYSVYIPIASSILISILLTILLNIIYRLLNK